MIPISTKLTLLVLLLPISIVVILDIATYYIYGNLIIEASNILSSILVFLLVWERLRDSLSKKMDYLEDNIFLGLHSLFQNDYDLWFDKEKGIKSLRTDLGRYGRFLVIRLFPTRLLEKIDYFLMLYRKFLGNVDQILGIVKQNFPSIDIDSCRMLLFHHLGFDVWYSSSKEAEIGIIAVVQSIEKDQVIGETKALYEKVKKMRKQIHEELQDFLKCNNLRLEPEPSVPWH